MISADLRSYELKKVGPVLRYAKRQTARGVWERRVWEEIAGADEVFDRYEKEEAEARKEGEKVEMEEEEEEEEGEKSEEEEEEEDSVEEVGGGDEMMEDDYFDDYEDAYIDYIEAQTEDYAFEHRYDRFDPGYGHHNS
jgi:hypothetical protein